MSCAIPQSLTALLSCFSSSKIILKLWGQMTILCPALLLSTSATPKRSTALPTVHIYMLAGSCIWSAVSKYQNGMPKVVKKAFNIGRSGTQYVAMVTKLLSSYWRAHLVEYYCKESNISDTKKLAEISLFIIFEQNLVECMTSSLG